MTGATLITKQCVEIRSRHNYCLFVYYYNDYSLLVTCFVSGRHVCLDLAIVMLLSHLLTISVSRIVESFENVTTCQLLSLSPKRTLFTTSDLLHDRRFVSL